MFKVQGSRLGSSQGCYGERTTPHGRQFQNQTANIEP
jgi:hypothetical protein